MEDWWHDPSPPRHPSIGHGTPSGDPLEKYMRDECYQVNLPISLSNWETEWWDNWKERARQANCKASYRAMRKNRRAKEIGVGMYTITVLGTLGGDILEEVVRDIHETLQIDIDDIPLPTQGDQEEDTQEVSLVEGAGVRAPKCSAMVKRKQWRRWGMRERPQAETQAQDDQARTDFQQPVQKESLKRPTATPETTGGMTLVDRDKERFFKAARKASEALIKYNLPDVRNQVEKAIAEFDYAPHEVQPRQIALCVTTLGRNHQIMHVLPVNLLLLWRWRMVVSVVLVDFNPDQCLEDYTMSSLAFAVDHRLLGYYRSDQLPHWHASIAKNTSHMMGIDFNKVKFGNPEGLGRDDENLVLVNLDGDNVITNEWLQHLCLWSGKLLGSNPEATMLHYHCWTSGAGSWGRMAVSSLLFCKIRGYDESFLPVGCQDTDLKARCAQLGHVVNCREAFVGTCLDNCPLEDASQAAATPTLQDNLVFKMQFIDKDK